jgi:transposase
MTEAEHLIAGLKPGYVIADKGYDSDSLRDQIRDQGARPAIPARAGRRRSCSAERYKKRNVVERFMNRIKHFRRVATRYDKTDAAYYGWVCLASLFVTVH